MAIDLPPTSTLGEWEIVQYAAQCDASLPKAGLVITVALWNEGNVFFSFTRDRTSSLVPGEKRDLLVSFDGEAFSTLTYDIAVPEDGPQTMLDLSAVAPPDMLEAFAHSQRLSYSYKGRPVVEFTYRDAAGVKVALESCVARIYKSDPFVD